MTFLTSCVSLLCALAAGRPSLAAAPPVPGRLVDIGGRMLHLVCTGSGSPTVVFESGLGEGWYSWYSVQPAVSQELRACSYDRAGIGFSDSGPYARTAAVLVEDLHELLHRAGEKPPYLLVGHSLGGLLVSRFAARYSRKTGGIVFVDSSHELGRFFPPEVVAFSGLARARRAGDMRRWQASGAYDEMGFPDGIPRDIVMLLRPRTRTAAWWNARFAESDLCDLADAVPEPLDCPIAVLSSTKWPRASVLSDAVNDAWAKVRRETQDELAARSPVSMHVFANTGHYIHIEAPDLVIDAIRKVAAESRHPRP